MWTGVVLALLAAAALGLLIRWARPGRNQAVSEEAQEFTEALATVDIPVAPSRLPAWFEPVRALLGLVGVRA